MAATTNTRTTTKSRPRRWIVYRRHSQGGGFTSRRTSASSARFARGWSACVRRATSEFRISNEEFRIESDAVSILHSLRRRAANRPRLPVLPHIHVNDLCLRDEDFPSEVVAADRFDDHLRGDGCVADAESLGPEAHQVADEHRLVKYDLVHRYGDHELAALPACFDRTGLVDVREDDAAEDGAVRVRVARHHENANGGLIPPGGDLHYAPCCAFFCCRSFSFTSI